MKFWKILRRVIEETLPEWQDKFLSYKNLKKQLNLIYPNQEVKEVNTKNGDSGRPNKQLRLQAGGDAAVEIGGQDCGEIAKEVTDFVKLLEEEIEKFNAFYVDKEEEYIIRLKVLQDKVGDAKDLSRDLMKVGREIVDLHGEMVLLENYSALNYTGLVKILKKYEKRSGALILMPFVQKVLNEPFFRHEILNKLLRECEGMLDHFFSLGKPSNQPEGIARHECCDTLTVAETTQANEGLLKFPDELVELEHMENVYVKLATSALRVLKEIRGGSSTVSIFSLPSLQNNELGHVWNRAPIIEREAK